MDAETSGLTLLVPLDGSKNSEQSLPYALALAAPDGAIRLITVVSPPGTLLGGLERSDVQRLVSDAASKHLDEVAERLRSRGVQSVTTLLANGDAAQEILANATDPAISMIVMTSAGRGALGRLDFGSVADRVARTSTIPVMIVRHTEEISAEEATIGRIIVPLDGSQRALRAMPIATELAKRLKVPMLLMTANEPSGLMYGHGASINVVDYQQIQDAIQSEMESRLEGQAEELKSEGIEVSTTIELGPPALALTRLCEQNDIIVMTSHGRSGITRWLIGSVAEQLVRKAPVPVILVPARD